MDSVSLGISSRNRHVQPVEIHSKHVCFLKPSIPTVVRPIQGKCICFGCFAPRKGFSLFFLDCGLCYNRRRQIFAILPYKGQG